MKISDTLLLLRGVNLLTYPLVHIIKMPKEAVQGGYLYGHTGHDFRLFLADRYCEYVWFLTAILISLQGVFTGGEFETWQISFYWLFLLERRRLLCSIS